MSLHLPDKWVWDFWFARQGEYTHIFLSASSAPAERSGDPALERKYWACALA